MNGRSERRQVRYLVGQVRRILLEDWDPLGVGEMPALSDEYDFVLGKVMGGLATAVDEEAVANLLGELERDYLCLPTPRPDLARRAADRLFALRRAAGRWPNTTASD